MLPPIIVGTQDYQRLIGAAETARQREIVDPALAIIAIRLEPARAPFSDPLPGSYKPRGVTSGEAPAL